MNEEQCVGYLAIVYTDIANNRFLELGGAGFTDIEQLERNWKNIPQVPESPLVLDREDQDCNVVADKMISRSTAEHLLGEPLDTLIQRAAQELEAREQ